MTLILSFVFFAQRRYLGKETSISMKALKGRATSVLRYLLQLINFLRYNEMTRMDKVSVNPYRPHSLLYIVWFRWWWFSPVRFGTSHCWDSA